MRRIEARISSAERVRSWIQSPPGWLRIEPIHVVLSEPGKNSGEFAAIRLALELGVKTFLCDDLAARRTAIDRGLQVVGTLGVLEEAANRGLLDLNKTLSALMQTNFRISRDLIQQLQQRTRNQPSP